MTTIKEILQPYISDSAFAKVTLSIKLRKDLERMANQDPRLKFFVYLVGCKSRDRDPLPDEVLALCDSLGIVTMDDLNHWLDVVHSETIMPLINPRLDFHLSETVQIHEIKQMITSHANLKADCTWDFGDINYHLIDEAELKQILAKCPINHRQYIADDFDCEDFARTTKAWLKLHDVENIAFGNAETRFYKDGKLAFAHGINIVPLRTGEVVCVEPQNDKYWPANEPEVGLGADEMRFRLIQF